MHILKYLDDTINGYYQKNKTYPLSIKMNKTTKDKVFEELALEVDLSLSWADSKNNYKGIPIKITNIKFIKLGG